MKKKEVDNGHCSQCDKYGHVDAKCWKLHPELCPYKNKNKEKTNAMVLRCDDIEGSSDVDEKVNCSAIQKVENPQDIEKKDSIIPPQNSNQENNSRLHYWSKFSRKYDFRDYGE